MADKRDHSVDGTFIPDENLCARDDSGGYDMPKDMKMCGEFGSGGVVAGGTKPYLTQNNSSSNN